MTDIRDLVRGFYTRLWEEGDPEAAHEILHEELVFRGSIGTEKAGIHGFWEYLSDVRAAFEDYRCDILELVAEEHRAAARMYFHGIHKGEFMRTAPTGRRIGWHGAAFFETREDRLVNIWVLGDMDGLRAALKGQG